MWKNKGLSNHLLQVAEGRISLFLANPEIRFLGGSFNSLEVLLNIGFSLENLMSLEVSPSAWPPRYDSDVKIVWWEAPCIVQ